MRRHYIFTDKRESKKGILSAMLGAMSLISVFLTVYFTWQNHGTAYVRYGVVTLLCLIFFCGRSGTWNYGEAGRG